jgi:hypothetical protein
LNPGAAVGYQADVLNCGFFNGAEICHEIDADSNIDIRDLRDYGRFRSRTPDGKFVRVALLKPAITACGMQALLIPADTVGEFLKANGVNPADGTT